MLLDKLVFNETAVKCSILQETFFAFKLKLNHVGCIHLIGWNLWDTCTLQSLVTLVENCDNCTKFLGGKNHSTHLFYPWWIQWWKMSSHASYKRLTLSLQLGNASIFST